MRLRRSDGRRRRSAPRRLRVTLKARALAGSQLAPAAPEEAATLALIVHVVSHQPSRGVGPRAHRRPRRRPGSRTFHVKPSRSSVETRDVPRGTRRSLALGHQRGRFDGTPTRRGQRSDSGHFAARHLAPASGSRPSSRQPVRRPEAQRRRAPAAGHLGAVIAPAGGSLTTSRPPDREKPDRAFGRGRRRAEARATTRSKSPASSGSRASSSARPHHTEHRSAMPSCRDRLAEELRTGAGWRRAATPGRLGQRVGEHEARQPAAGPEVEEPPGTPGAAGRAPAIGVRMLELTTATGPGPENPRRLLRCVERAQARGHGITSRPASGRTEHHPATRVLALGLGGHAVDLGRGVVDDLAVRRRHRLERLGPAALEHLGRQRAGELLERLPALGPVARRRRRGCARRDRRSGAAPPCGPAPRSR